MKNKTIKLHCGACNTWNHVPNHGEQKCNVCQTIISHKPATPEEIAAAKALNKVARAKKREEVLEAKAEAAAGRREAAEKLKPKTK